MKYLKAFVFLISFLFTVASARDLAKAKTSNIDAKTISTIENGGGLSGGVSGIPYFGGLPYFGPGTGIGSFSGIDGSGYPWGGGSRGLFPGGGSRPYFGGFPGNGNGGFSGIDGSRYPGGGGGWSGRQYFGGFPGTASGGFTDIDGSGYPGRRGGRFSDGGGYRFPGLW